MSRIPSTLIDRLELPFLIGIQDQKLMLDRIRKQTALGMSTIAAGGQNGVAVATTPTTAANTSHAAEDDQSLSNRCVTNNYYVNQDTGAATQPTPSAAPAQPTHWGRIPAWVTVLLIAVGVAVAGLLWWLYTHPAQPATLPVQPTQNVRLRIW
jgi:hypothetical protein